MRTGKAPLILVRTDERAASARVVQVTVNDPDRRNVLGIAGKQQLAAAFRQIGRDPLVRVVVLTGAGVRSFIAGARSSYTARVSTTRVSAPRGGTTCANSSDHLVGRELNGLSV